MSEQYLGYDAAGFTQWLKPFLATAKVYKSAKGMHIVELDSFAGLRSGDERKYLASSLFLSMDHGPTTFQQLHCDGFSGTMSGTDRMGQWSGEFPEGKQLKQFRLLVEGNVMTLMTELENGQIGTLSKWEQFQLIQQHGVNLQRATFIPLPEVRQPEYLFRRPNGEIIFADNVKYGYAYERMRLFMGLPVKMVQISIKKLERYRDGGTTIIWTDSGVLFCATPFGKENREYSAAWILDKDAVIKHVEFDAIVAGAYGSHELLAEISARNNEAIQALMGWLM